MNKDHAAFLIYLGLELGVDVTKEEIMNATHAKSCRVLYQMNVPTKDYRRDRVNIHIGRDGFIHRIDMG